MRHPLLVLQAPNGCRFAIVELGGGAHGVEDLDAGELLADLRGDLNPILVDDQIIFAGERDDHRTDHVVLTLPDDLQTCRIKNDVWLSIPVPFTPGMRFSAAWRDAAGHELWRHDFEPLRQMRPVYGPEWKAYEPSEIRSEHAASP
jgi:hypothetical protein